MGSYEKICILLRQGLLGMVPSLFRITSFSYVYHEATGTSLAVCTSQIECLVVGDISSTKSIGGDEQ